MLLALTFGAFVAAYEVTGGFWSEFLLIVGGAGLAAVVAVSGVEVLLRWQREDAWGEVREQVLNSLRRSLEQVAFRTCRTIGVLDQMPKLRAVLVPGTPPASDALEGLDEVVSKQLDENSTENVPARPRFPLARRGPSLDTRGSLH